MNPREASIPSPWSMSGAPNVVARERLSWIGPARYIRPTNGRSIGRARSVWGESSKDRSGTLAGSTVLRPPGVPGRAPWHPGRFLRRNYLTPLGLSQTEAARLLGVSRRRLHEIVHGQRGITADTAIRCALVFGTDAAFWLSLQSAWDSFHSWKLFRVETRSRRGAH